MAAGRVVRFNSVKGYGFIAPEHGGEDVFLHVNDLLIPHSQVRPGMRVEFDVEDSGRGLKASAVRPARGTDADPLSSGGFEDGDEPMCDVLSTEEYTAEVTELLLRAAPALTGEQIVLIRRELLQFAKAHGWIEG